MSTHSLLRSNIPLRRTVFAIGANQLSDAMSYISVPLIMLFLTGSPENASLALFATGVTRILASFLTGVIVDRYKPTYTLTLSCLGQCITWIVLTLCVLANVGSVPILIGILCVMALASSFDYPSEQAIIARVVPTKQLGYASGLGETRESAANLIGSPLAGLLASSSLILTACVHAFVNFTAFLAAPSSSTVVHAERKHRQAGSETTVSDTVIDAQSNGFFADLTQGLMYVVKNRVLVAIASVACCANFAATGLPLVFIYYYAEQGIAAYSIGIFACVFGAGVLLGSLAVGWMTERFALGTLGVLAVGMMVICYMTAAFTHDSFWVTCALMLISGVPLPAFNSSIVAYINASTPVDMIGRVHSAQGIPNMLLAPVAALLAGIMYVQWGISRTVLFYGSFMVLALILMLSQRSLRTLPKLSEMAPASD